MNPLRITAQNLKSYEDLDIELPDGVTVILGPNGAGKSTILQAIDLALYAGGRELAGAVRRGSRHQLVLELQFAHQGDIYTVRRSHDPVKRSSTVDFLRDGVPLTRETARETQALIEQTIGVSRRTLRASSFLMQGDSGAFTETDPRTRKQILTEVLGLDVYDALLERAKADHKAVEKLSAANLVQRNMLAERVLGEDANARQMLEAAGQVEVFDREVAGRQAAYEVTVRVVADLEARERNAAEAREQHRRAVAECDRLRAEISSLRGEIEDVGRHEAKLRFLGDAPTQLKMAEEHDAAQAEAVRRYSAERDRLEQADKELSRLHIEQTRLVEAVKHANAAEERLRGRIELADSRHSCPTCGADVPEAHLKDVFSELFADHERALDDATKAGDRLIEADQRVAEAIERREEAKMLVDDQPTDVVDTKAELDRARQLAEEHQKIMAWLGARDEGKLTTRLVEAEAELRAAADRVVEVDSDAQLVSDLAAARRARDELAGEVERVRGEQRGVIEQVARLTRDAELIADAKTEIRNLEELIEADQDALRLSAVLMRAFGRDGIPTMIVESAAIPAIEEEANRILGDLGVAFTVTLRTQKELKGGGTAETLDVVVDTPTGESLYEAFSGGERSRLNFALRVGLARLLAGRRGAEVGILAVDEVEYLDGEGMSRLASVLGGLSGEFEKVVMISHHGELTDVFDQSLIVAKDRDRSLIQGGVPV